MTHEELVEKVRNRILMAYELAEDGEQPKAMAEAALAAVYETMIAPDKKMCRAAAKAMSSGKRPTQSWVSSSDKHAYRFMAMIEASPLKPICGVAA